MEPPSPTPARTEEAQHIGWLRVARVKMQKPAAAAHTHTQKTDLAYIHIPKKNLVRRISGSAAHRHTQKRRNQRVLYRPEKKAQTAEKEHTPVTPFVRRASRLRYYTQRSRRGAQTAEKETKKNPPVTPFSVGRQGYFITH